MAKTKPLAQYLFHDKGSPSYKDYCGKPFHMTAKYDTLQNIILDLSARLCNIENELKTNKETMRTEALPIKFKNAVKNNKVTLKCAEQMVKNGIKLA